MTSVLIVGCGYVGSALAEILVGEGHSVWGLRRQPTGLPPGVQAIACDVTRPDTLEALGVAPEVVVYACAATRRDDEGYRLAYVDGPRNLLAALGPPPSPRARLFYVSSTSVFQQSRGEWVDEDSPAEPTHFTGRRLLEGERTAAARWPTTVLRLGGIYGPGRTGLIERVRRGLGYPSSPPLYSNRIHRDDAAGALAHLIGLESPADLYLGVDGSPAPLHEISGWIASELGLPEPSAGEPGEDSRAQRSNKRIRNQRLVGTGYRFRYEDFRAGLTPLLAADSS